MRLARIVVMAAAGAAVVGAASYGLLHATLARPSKDDRVAVALLGRLEHTRGTRSLELVNGRLLSVRCRRLSPHRQEIALGQGGRLVLAGRRIVAAVAPTAGGDRFLASREAPPSLDLLSAEAALAGSHNFYASVLAGRLLAGRSIIAGTILLRGRRVYRIRVGRDRPRVDLLVDSRTLDLLAATYASAHVVGWADLAPSLPGRELTSPRVVGC